MLTAENTSLQSAISLQSVMVFTEFQTPSLFPHTPIIYQILQLTAFDSQPYITKKTGLHISCKLSTKEIIHMKCQILFSWKKKKNINLSAADFIQSAKS